MEEFREIRRRDRALDEADARRLLEGGEYGVLSVHGANGYGYGIPLNYVFEEDRIYFHCAPKGFKLDSLRADNRASFCVVGCTQVIPGQFTTAYESAVVFGRAALDLEEDERLRALNLLVSKYSPQFQAESEPYISRSFARTNVIRFDIHHFSAKSKRIANPDAKPAY